MKILQFAFSVDERDGEIDAANAYLPHNVDENSVIYTGTHDNDTTLGWYKSQSDKMKDIVRRYFECSDEDIVYRFIRAALSSRSRYAVIPFQDVLGLDSDARMNVPSTCGTSNWSWKMSQGMLDDDNFGRLRYYIRMYNR